VVVPDLQARSSAKVAVGVQDKRSYVVTNDKTPNFVGLQRGGYGNPFDVTTASGQPLASDFARSIVSGLEIRKIAAHTVAIPPGTTRKVAIQSLVGKGAKRSLLVTLIEWKSDTMVNLALYYDLSAEVLDTGGKVVAQSARQGREAIAGSFWNAPAAARANVPHFYRKLLADLLNDKKIVNALK
jgi:hypothetical protein